MNLEPPYVLVGHSLGGAYIRGFAVYYPEMLAGLVIIDPADFTETRKNRRLPFLDIGLDTLTAVVQSVDKRMLFYSGDAGHFVHYDDPELLISSIRILLQDYELLRSAD